MYIPKSNEDKLEVLDPSENYFSVYKLIFRFSRHIMEYKKIK